MKKLLISIAMLTLIGGCSSNAVNDAKTAGAETIGKALEKLADKEYAKLGPEYEIYDCRNEAFRLGDDATKFIKEKLKVKSTTALERSAAGEIAKVACGFVASKIVPELILKNAGNYTCFSLVASGSAEDFIRKELCDSIEF
jgi:uncharacterized protein YceK